MPNRLRLCFAFVFLFLFIASVRLQAQNLWFPTGPDGGKVTALAIHPNTQRIVYAGTDGGGVFKSADGGRTWFPVNNGLFNLFIRDLVIDPQAPDTLYVAAGYLPTVAGVYKTTDGGGIWRNVSGGLPTPPPFCGCGGLMPVTDLAIDPGTPRILYAVAGGQVYKTERGGGWFSASSGLNDGGVLTVEVAPSTPNVLYAGTVTGVYTSANRGATWIAATTGVGAQPVRALAIDPRDSRTVYAGTDPSGVFKTTDGGASWSPASQGLLDRQVFALAIDPSNPANLWAGTGQSVYKSTDAARSWRQVPTGVPPSPIGALAVAPSAPNVIFAGPSEIPWVRSGPGVFKSTDRGETWAVFQQGLKASVVNSLASAGAAGALFAGTSGGGVFRTDNGGIDWQPRNAGLPQTRDVLSLATDPSDPEVVYAGIGGGGGVYKSVDGGASWTFASTGLTIPATSNALVSPEDLDIDPENPSTLFAAGSGGFYRSTNGGATWVQIITLLRESLTLAIAPSNPSVIYAGGGYAFRASYPSDPTLFRSRDGGTTWEVLTAINSLVFALAVDPRDADTVYAGLTDGVARSTDGGATWTRLSLGTVATVRALAIDPSNPDVLYAGTPYGVFRSPDRGTTWLSYSQGLQNREVLDILITPPSFPTGQATIYAATRGGGVYRLDRVPCVPGENILCLQSGRFQVATSWRDFQGQTGTGHAVPLTPDTGAFWFFGRDNLELMVKVIDGRAINQHYWVFFGALTNVEYTLVVTDTETGQVRPYFNRSGLFASQGDTSAFRALDFTNPVADAAADEAPAGPVTSPAGACAPGDTALCLQSGRFRVEVTWEDFAGNTGAGHAVPLTPDTGAFWFFGPANLELMIKVVDGRAVNGKYWVFYGALTNVGYTIRVTDTATGAVKSYTNPKGTFASAGDTQAF